MTYINSDDLRWILLKLSYQDVLNFCTMNDEAKIMCQDTDLWKQKLDQDFTFTTSTGIQIIPSDYVTLYGYDLNSETYKRWTQTNIDQIFHTIPKDPDFINFGTNKDIVMWRLNTNQDEHRGNFRIILTLINFIYKDKDLLQWLNDNNLLWYP